MKSFLKIISKLQTTALKPWLIPPDPVLVLFLWNLLSLRYGIPFSDTHTKSLIKKVL